MEYVPKTTLYLESPYYTCMKIYIELPNEIKMLTIVQVANYKKKLQCERIRRLIARYSKMFMTNTFIMLVILFNFLNCKLGHIYSSSIDNIILY